MFPFRKSTATQVLQFTMVDSTTGLAKTGLSIANTDIKLIFEAGTTQTNKNSGGATEIGSTGTYYCTFDATDTATLGRLHIDIQKAGALPYWKDAMVMTAAAWDALYAASGGYIPSDIQRKLGTAYSESGAGRLVAGEKKFFDVAAPASTMELLTAVTTATTVTNQLTGAAIATAVWTDIVAGDFTTSLSIGKSIMNGVSLGTGLTVARCTLVDTLTTYTGNTVQTGDAFARIGVAGAGLTALGDTRLANLDAPISGLNNLSALCNIYGSPLLEIPDSSSTTFAFTVVTRDNEGKLKDLDGSPSLTAANAAGTDRSSNLSAVSHPSTGRYTFTYSVSSAAAEESLRITVSGTISAEDRYVEWIGAVVNYDTLTTMAAIKAKTDQLTFTVANQIDANELSHAGTSQTAGDVIAKFTSTGGIPLGNFIDRWQGMVVLGAGSLYEFTTAALRPVYTNITAGTITTATNLTNAPTNGDFTAAMKTSITTAATAATPTVTAGTVTDKAGYALTSAYDAAKTAAAAGAAMTLTVGERDSIAAALLGLANGVETSLTVKQALQAMASALCGLSSGVDTGSPIYKAANNSGTTRITATASSGNRSSVTLNV